MEDKLGEVELSYSWLSGCLVSRLWVRLSDRFECQQLRREKTLGFNAELTVDQTKFSSCVLTIVLHRDIQQIIAHLKKIRHSCFEQNCMAI